MARTRADSAGFSLVEVILALALLAGVLVSIAGLFVLGGRQVRSGRATTQALSVARSILEETHAWGFHELPARLGTDGSTVSHTVDSRTEPRARRWQDRLDGQLRNAFASVRIESIGTGTGTPPALEDASAVRVSVEVRWEEGARRRSLRLATVRL